MIFDIDTRVRCVGKAAGDPVKIGDIGTVIDESNAPTVQWDRPRPGMNGNDSNIWCMTSEELEPHDNDFPLGQACDLSGEGSCESCQ